MEALFKNARQIVVGALVLVLVWTGFFQIGAEEVGIITRFGKYTREVNSGLNFKIPLIEGVVKVPVERQQKQEFGFRTVESNVRSDYTKRGTADESLMLTGDLNLADVEWVVQYRISNAYQYLFKVRHPEITLRDLSESSMRQVVGDRTVNDGMTVGRTEVALAVKDLIQNLSDEYELGIRIEQVVLQDVNPPDPVKSAFNAVNEAQQEKETLINQAKSEYNRVIPHARGQARETIQKAEGYATARVNNAQGEATRFELLYQEYVKAPEVTRRRLYMETMQRVLPELGNKIITDQEGNNVLPLLQMPLSPANKQ